MQITTVVPGLAAGVGLDLEPKGTTCYYVEWSIGELSRVDTSNGTAQSVMTGLQFPQDVEVDWDTGDIFVSERTGAVSQVFEKEGAKKVIEKPGGAPHQLSLKKNGGQRALYTVCYDSGDLVRIDPDGPSMATVASGLGHPVGLVVDDAEKLAWVTEQDTGSITEVELSSGTKKPLIGGLTAPFFLAWDKDRTGIYCVQRDPSNSLIRFDLASNTSSLVANGLAWRPSGVMPNDDDSLIYICADQQLQVISWNGPPPIDPPDPPFEVHSIEFNWDGSKAIRLYDHLAKAPIQTPEYVNGVRNDPASFPGGFLPHIKVVFRELPPFNGGPYRIGAIGNLGGIRPKVVTPNFGGSGLSDPIDFEFMWPLAKMVAKPDVLLDWYAREANVPAGTAMIGAAKHRIYVPLAYPVAPWGDAWVGAFELACGWAGGATTFDGAAGLITERYNSSGAVSYDTNNGATMYGYYTFSMSQMLERLTGGLGLGNKVNCTDSANTVTTLSNLLGCELWESQMASQFYMNEIIAIGYNTWAAPFWGGFSYHEVAWKGGATENDPLFDGCLKVDGDSDPTTSPHTPLLPVNMLFGDCSTMNYRLRLCTPNPDGCPQCKPQTGTRQRRPID